MLRAQRSDKITRGVLHRPSGARPRARGGRRGTALAAGGTALAAGVTAAHCRVPLALPQVLSSACSPETCLQETGGEGGRCASWSLHTGGGCHLGGGWAGGSSPLYCPGPRGSVGSMAQENQQPQTWAPSRASPGKPRLLPVPARLLAPADAGTLCSVTGACSGLCGSFSKVHMLEASGPDPPTSLSDHEGSLPRQG